MTDNDKMREAFEKWYMTNTFAHVDHLSVFYNDLNCYPTPIANHCWKAWQAAQSVPAADELERLRKDAAKVLNSEQIRIAAVAAVRAVTGCPDLKGKDGAYLVDEIIVRLLEMQNDAAIAAEGEKE